MREERVSGNVGLGEGGINRRAYLILEEIEM